MSTSIATIVSASALATTKREIRDLLTFSYENVTFLGNTFLRKENNSTPRCRVGTLRSDGGDRGFCADLAILVNTEDASIELVSSVSGPYHYYSADTYALPSWEECKNLGLVPKTATLTCRCGCSAKEHTGPAGAACGKCDSFSPSVGWDKQELPR